MKSFYKRGRYLGFMLMAIGLVFAGCVSGGSDGGSADTEKMVGVNSIPVIVENGKIEFGNGEVMASSMFNGKFVGLSTGATYDNTGGYYTAAIRLTNQDPDEYMANAMVHVVPASCPVCSGALFDNADFTTFGANCNTGTYVLFGCPALIDGGAGYVYVEDGDFVDTNGGEGPWQVLGGALQQSKGAGNVYGTPKQMIHPECGSVSQDWVFANNPGGRYSFFITVTADYFGYGDLSDSRYDLDHRSTYYAIVANNVNNATPAWVRNAATWRRSNKAGSPNRSQIVSGYVGPGQTMAPNGTQVSAGDTLGVTIAMEFPNRLELQTTAIPSAVTSVTTGYEYYVQVSAILRYNEAVMNMTTGPETTCATASYCDISYQKSSGMSITGSTGGTDGWVAVTTGLASPSQFSTFGQYEKYFTSGGGGLYFYSAGNPNICKQCGHRGRAKLNVDPFSSSYSVAPSAMSTALFTQDLDDPEPDLEIAWYEFTVDAAAPSGSGSEFWFDTYGDDMQAISYHTNDTFWESGRDCAACLDLTAYCYPMDGDPMYDYCTPLLMPSRFVKHLLR